MVNIIGVMMSSEVPKVTPRDTKSTILDAHNTALKKLAALEKNPRVVAQTQKNAEIVGRQSKVSIENIVNDLAATRLLVTDSLADLEKNLIEKRTQLEEIQVSIIAEDANLKDAMGINREVDSFAALVQAQKDQRFTFAQEMGDSRASWSKEQATHLTALRERNDEAAKAHKRQQEEYVYQFAKTKEEAQDTFDQEKRLRMRGLEEHENSTVRGLQEREATVKTNEIEYETLQGQVDQFASQLEEAKIAAYTDAKTRASKSHGFEVRAIKKDAESAQALLDQQVGTLQSQVSALTSERDDFKNRLEKASSELKDVATEAIRGAQQKTYYTPPTDKK